MQDKSHWNVCAEPLSSYRNIIFDIGGVLLEWNPAGIVSAVFNNPEDQNLVLESVFHHDDWIRFDMGIIGEEEAVYSFSRRLGYPSRTIRRLMDAYRRSLVPVKGSMELLRECVELGMNLYCLSNMNSEVYSYLRSRYDFWDCFKGVVLSGDVKMVKPDPEIYRHLLSRYSITPAESIYVDDRDENVESARQLGMKGIRFSSARKFRDELYSLLNRRV
jgi:FMN phosphatase YigB (HAD superfamily)